MRPLNRGSPVQTVANISKHTDSMAQTSPKCELWLRQFSFTSIGQFSKQTNCYLLLLEDSLMSPVRLLTRQSFKLDSFNALSRAFKHIYSAAAAGKMHILFKHGTLVMWQFVSHSVAHVILAIDGSLGNCQVAIYTPAITVQSPSVAFYRSKERMVIER